MELSDLLVHMEIQDQSDQRDLQERHRYLATQHLRRLSVRSCNAINSAKWLLSTTHLEILRRSASARLDRTK